MYNKDFLSGIIGFMSSFSVAGRFFILMQLYSCCFFHSLSLNKGETESYVKLTAEEIAVKRSVHFSFSPTVFSLYWQCYWPLVGIWISKRHFISLRCSYSQGKGGKSCTVFLFYLPSVWTCRWTWVKLLYFPHMPPSLVSHTYFVLCLKLRKQTEKLKHIAESIENVFLGSCWYLWIIRLSGFKVLKWSLKSLLW